MSSKTQIGKETNDINPSIQWFGNMFAAKSVPRHKVKQWCSTEQKHGQFQFILFPGLHSKATSLAPGLAPVSIKFVPELSLFSGPIISCLPQAFYFEYLDHPFSFPPPPPPPPAPMEQPDGK